LGLDRPEFSQNDDLGRYLLSTERVELNLLGFALTDVRERLS
jgi:predicted NAD-dependent protein-ADP-ribosyltransferase YbiA (DUF1768 family)